MSRQTAVCALLIVATLAGAVTGATASDVLALDEATPLTADDAISEFQSAGAVERNVSQIELTLTVASQRSQANISGATLPGSPGDLTTTYLCADYREELTRPVRFYLPDDYAVPRHASLSAINGGPQAQLEPIDGRNHTAVTVRFEGQTRACYGIDTVQGTIVRVKSWSSNLLNQSIGIQLPTLGGSSQWQYPPAGAFQNNSTYAIPADNELTVQYDDTTQQREPTWLSVPDCSDPADQDVCVVERTDENVQLLASDEAPPVRWKTGSDPIADMQSALRDLGRVPSRLMDMAGDLFGGVL